MKVSIKLAVIGALAIMGGVANAANLNTSVTDATGSSLLLLLKNSTDNEFLAFQLSPVMTDVKSNASLAADPNSKYSLDGDAVHGALNVPAALNGFTNANLSSYLTAANHIGDNISWTILGGKTNGNDTFAYTSVFGDQLQSNWTGGDVTTSAGGVSDLIAEINLSAVTNGVSTTGGYGSGQPVGSQAPGSFFSSANAANGAALGSAQSLFLISQGTEDSFAANVYKSTYTLTLSAAGLLTYDAPTSTVPVPAAIWLLGSGLMGLVGVGRRRNVAVAA